LAYEHLHAGRYAAGFRLFEWRWHPEIIANQPIPYPREPAKPKKWRGESLLDKSIVVQMEQGFGDIFMYARFLPFLKVLGTKKLVVLSVPPVLRLLGQMECIDQLTNLTEEGPGHDCDYWIGSMSLPYYIDCAPSYAKNLFPITKDKVIASEGYFDAVPSGIERKIGVNWGASSGALKWIKSISAEQMVDLVGDDTYSLNPESDGVFRPLPEDGWKKDWSITAKHMKAMKGVVTVDTGTAHLAGALGVKCVVLLPQEEFVCWRWKNARWYDSVVALRQDEYHKVAELIRRM
jgi:hypothetical protein